MTTVSETETSGPVNPLITGTLRRAVTEADFMRCEDLHGDAIDPEDGTPYLVTLTLRGRDLKVAYIKQPLPVDSDLWALVHHLIDGAVELEYDRHNHFVDWLEDLDSVQREAFELQCDRVTDWLGPDLWAACLAANEAAEGRDFFEKFVKALCSPAWESYVCDSRFDAELRERGYPMPGQFWGLAGADRPYYKVEQLGATTVWVQNRAGQREAIYISTLMKGWHHMKNATEADWTASK